MGGNGCNDDGPGGIPSQYCNTGCRDAGTEGRWREMGVGLGGCGAGGDKDLANKGVIVETIGNMAEYVTGRPIHELCIGA